MASDVRQHINRAYRMEPVGKAQEVELSPEALVLKARAMVLSGKYIPLIINSNSEIGPLNVPPLRYTVATLAGTVFVATNVNPRSEEPVHACRVDNILDIRVCSDLRAQGAVAEAFRRLRESSQPTLAQVFRQGHEPRILKPMTLFGSLM